ncbi:hypothetical protein J3R83DRAFT_8470 [Lanmaoa asiatica]|nr:hypothetical protein J3R83DRAFT_8470 [Lanmaoa asiatica]
MKILTTSVSIRVVTPPALIHDRSGVDAPSRTAAELAREKKLRDDPMAEVHGPLFVTCKRCGSRIKLSPKSSYDPFHWMKHRERCLRKPIGVARAARRTPKDIYTCPAKKSPTSSSNTDGDNATPPPLTPDDDRPSVSDVFRERSLSPNIDDLDLSTNSVVRELDSAFLDYLHRSQRPLPKHVPLVERWQTWNWSELRPPAWIANNNFASASDDQEDNDDDHDDSLLHPVEMRYPAPRLTLHLGTYNQDAPSLSA